MAFSYDDGVSGTFFSFEGGEGAGKSTVLKAVAAKLAERGYDVVTTREPGAGELGQGIRNLLLHSGDVPTRAELLLFLADRASHVETLIKPALERGAVILCDRYVDSTTVYQAKARGLDAQFVAQGNAFATGGLLPRRTYLLDLPVEVGLARAKGGDRLDAAPMEFHQKVREGFLELAQENSSRWLVVDASQLIESVIETVLEDALAILLAKLDPSPLGEGGP